VVKFASLKVLIYDCNFFQMSASVREWDLGKVGQMSPTEKEPKHEEKNKEREKRARKEKIHHSRSASPHDAPGNAATTAYIKNSYFCQMFDFCCNFTISLIWV